MRSNIYSNSLEFYESDGYQLKFWIKNLIEDKFTKVSEGRRDLKVADVNFAYTMIKIFFGQFINTAFLIVLNNASFEDFDGGKGPLSAIFTVGTETDFSVL
jgi:hypothetical protein